VYSWQAAWNGVYQLEDRQRDGVRAGMEAAAYLGFPVGAAPAVARGMVSPNHPYPIFEHPRGKNFVDFDEDLQLKDFADAAQEGFDNIELLKRYTTVGMGPSQGKHSNMNAIRVLAKLKNTTAGEIGNTTARPFFHPVPMSHLAGRGFHPYRLTPLHSRHESAGAVFMQAGVWLRPEYYAAGGQSKRESLREEAAAVRSRVGIIDVGTLGKNGNLRTRRRDISGARRTRAVSAT
jgi:sarcosine oxidase subunit alpha